MPRDLPLLKVKSPLTLPADTENGPFQWLTLLSVALGLVAAIRFFWTLAS
jgi:hypothetical protein